jgi:predicted nucleotidyltransferase
MQEMDAFGVRCRFVTLEKLIQLKRAAGRPKDLEVIAELQALLEERRKLHPDS